jgi:hypothetical protein
MTPITVITPTGTLGYGFGEDALDRAMGMRPSVIAVDAGSTDPGPHYLGSGKPLVSDVSVKRELTALIRHGRRAATPVIVGSVGGAGCREQVDRTAQLVRVIAWELGLKFRLATIHADVPIERAKRAVERGEVVDFEAGVPLTTDDLDQTTNLVAQMGHEPICAALDGGADVIIAGRACDDSVIAAYPIWRGADSGLAIHMGKILECGAFSAEPFAMDVMMGTLHEAHFILEPGSLKRKASVKSVAAHSLYERENPFKQSGPGHTIDLTGCSFEQVGERQVRVQGARLTATAEYHVKLEGARLAGYRSIAIAGIRCPTTIAALDGILADVKDKAIAYFHPASIAITFHVYGRDGVMKLLERDRGSAHEVGLVIDVVAADQALALAACHQISGAMLHYHYDGIVNTSGNLAFPYSPSDLELGPVYAFSAYHLMKVDTPMELFPVNQEDL